MEGTQAIIWKILRVAEQAWRKLNVSVLLPLVASGVLCKDGGMIQTGSVMCAGTIRPQEDRRLNPIYTPIDRTSEAAWNISVTELISSRILGYELILKA